jgi:hypothetical protein
VPSVENVTRNESPGARSIEPKAAVSDVTVWLIAPVFVQQTVVFNGTVFVPPWNE